MTGHGVIRRRVNVLEKFEDYQRSNFLMNVKKTEETDGKFGILQCCIGPMSKSVRKFKNCCLSYPYIE